MVNKKYSNWVIQTPWNIYSLSWLFSDTGECSVFRSVKGWDIGCFPIIRKAIKVLMTTPNELFCCIKSNMSWLFQTIVRIFEFTVSYILDTSSAYATMMCSLWFDANTLRTSIHNLPNTQTKVVDVVSSCIS